MSTREYVRLVSVHLCTMYFSLPLLKDVISPMIESVINHEERHTDKGGYT